MNFYKKVIILCAVFFKIQTFAMTDVPGPLPGIGDQPRLVLAATYRDLCGSVNNNGSIINFSNALNNFEDAINFPIPVNIVGGQVVVAYNHANFITRSRLTLNRIDGIGIEFLAKNLKAHEELLKQRVDLARIDENVRLGDGVISHFNHPNLSVNAQNSLNILTGRIFQISVGINPALVSTSSGTLANYNPLGIGIQNKLPQLIPGNNQALNSIVTCAHAFKSDDGRTTSYFVPSNQIDLQSGLPNGIVLVHNDERDLILYLTNNLNSFRITGLCAQDKVNGNQFIDVDLTMGQPQFLENEDCVIATIVSNIGGALLPYVGNSTINFFRNQPLLNTRCFSLGYPGCFHYARNAFNVHPYTNLINDLGCVYPLLITSDPLNLPVFNNGLISCHIPAAQGMSGGDLLYETINIGQSTIDIFGRVTAGDRNDDFGSYLL